MSSAIWSKIASSSYLHKLGRVWLGRILPHNSLLANYSREIDCDTRDLGLGINASQWLEKELEAGFRDMGIDPDL